MKENTTAPARSSKGQPAKAPLISRQTKPVQNIIRQYRSNNITSNHKNEHTSEHEPSLHSQLKEKFSSALSHDFSTVRIHKGSEVNTLLDTKDAKAMTVDREVFINDSKQKLGTPAGDLLLAHELTHVKQNDNSNTSEGESYQRELEANTHSLEAMSKLHRWMKYPQELLNKLSKTAMGVAGQYQRCSNRAASFDAEPPEYFGEHSRETFDTIKRRIEASDALSDMLVYGPILTTVLSNPLEVAAGGGHPLEQQAQALAAVPVILKNRITQDIDLLLVMHGNSLNAQETRYWHALREVINR